MSPIRLKAAGDAPLERKILWYERTRTIAVILAVLFAFVALIVVMLTNVTASDSRDRLTALAERVLSCTERGTPEAGKPPDAWAKPPGRCYLESQRAQSQVVGEPAGGINTVVVAAAACASLLPHELERAEAQRLTLACTRATLAESTGAAP